MDKDRGRGHGRGSEERREAAALVYQKHHGRTDCDDGLRTGSSAWNHVANNCYVPRWCVTIGSQYLGKMTDGSDLLALNLAWVGWEVARWQEVIDWSVSALGALTLVVLNLLRLRKAWIQHRDVNNAEK